MVADLGRGRTFIEPRVRTSTVDAIVAERVNGYRVDPASEVFVTVGAMEALLIDRSGQLLARGGASRSLDTVSLSALAAGAFSSTAAVDGARVGGCGRGQSGVRALEKARHLGPQSWR